MRQPRRSKALLSQVREREEGSVPKIAFSPGDQVRVADGPFESQTGIGRGNRSRARRAARLGQHLRPLYALSTWNTGRWKRHSSNPFAWVTSRCFYGLVRHSTTNSLNAREQHTWQKKSLKLSSCRSRQAQLTHRHPLDRLSVRLVSTSWASVRSSTPLLRSLAVTSCLPSSRFTRTRASPSSPSSLLLLVLLKKAGKHRFRLR